MWASIRGSTWPAYQFKSQDRENVSRYPHKVKYANAKKWINTRSCNQFNGYYSNKKYSIPCIIEDKNSRVYLNSADKPRDANGAHNPWFC